MKKNSFVILAVLFFFIALTLGSCKSEDDKETESLNSVRVTYIANAGYLIETADYKILIDALFTRGLRLYDTPSKDICSKIISGEAPFDNIKALFITHAHEDHYNPMFVKMFLESDEKRYVICSDITGRIIEKKFNTDNYQLYKDRIKEITPTIYSSIDSYVDDMKFKVFRLRHSGESENDKNLGYLISMNGINIFHSGDNDGYVDDGEIINGIQEYYKLNMENENIDIAIVNRGMLWEQNSPGIEIIKKYIKPQIVILSHLSKNDAQGELGNVMDALDANKNDLPNVIKFENSMDSRNFEF